MKRLIALLALGACAAPREVPPNDSGHPEEATVRAAIQEVFDGMRAKDSAMVSARLVEGAVLHRADELSARRIVRAVPSSVPNRSVQDDLTATPDAKAERGMETGPVEIDDCGPDRLDRT